MVWTNQHLNDIKKKLKIKTLFDGWPVAMINAFIFEWDLSAVHYQPRKFSSSSNVKINQFVVWHYFLQAWPIENEHRV